MLFIITFFCVFRTKAGKLLANGTFLSSGTDKFKRTIS